MSAWQMDTDRGRQKAWRRLRASGLVPASATLGQRHASTQKIGHCLKAVNPPRRRMADLFTESTPLNVDMDLQHAIAGVADMVEAACGATHLLRQRVEVQPVCAVDTRNSTVAGGHFGHSICALLSAILPSSPWRGGVFPEKTDE
jgi:hypothetical protein